MQFFDRPKKSKIALRGSSSRQPSSQELLANARKAREQRARSREQHNAAKTLQAAYRRTVAVRTLATSLLDAPPPSDVRTAIVQMLVLSGLLTTSNQSLSANVSLLRTTIRARPFVTIFAQRLINVLATKHSKLTPLLTPHSDLPESMLVKAVIVLLAVIAEHLSTSTNSHATSEEIQNMLMATCTLTQHLTHNSLETKAKWGFYIYVVDVLRHIPTDQSFNVYTDAFRDAILASLERDNHEHASPYYSSLTHRQFALSLFALNKSQAYFPLKGRESLTIRLLSAISNEETPTSERGFAWDFACSYSSLDVNVAAVMLSNVMEVGSMPWHSKDTFSLWSFLSVVSSLIQILPMDYVDPAQSDDDEEMSFDDHDVAGGATKGSSRVLMARLSQAFRQIVSQDAVRSIFTAAAAEGQQALIRACRLFNFLIKREKGLGLSDSFLGSLAFWRGSRGEGSKHILKTLWLNCKKAHGDTEQENATMEPTTMLAMEASPILAVFVSAYAYFLFIQDGDELFEANWPFSIDEVREITQILKHYLFGALYQASNGRLTAGSRVQYGTLLRKEHNLTDDVTKLLSRLYACDSQRPFRTGEDFWLAGRGILSSDAFVQDAIQAGPNALSQSQEASGIGRDMSHSAVRAGSATGAGELLRVAPYLVPFSARAKIFQSWVARERDNANEGRNIILTGGTTVYVRRKFIFEDAFQELNAMGHELRATLRFKFIDEHGLEEAGIDGGGVYKEFMHEVLKIGFSPYHYGLFKTAPDGRMYPSPDAAVGNENFRTQFAFLGRLLGKAVFDGVLVNVPLASFFLAKILNQVNHPIDLGSLDPELYRNMKYLKNCPTDIVEDLGLNFTIANNAFGMTKEVELKPNGKNIAVTASNRIEYMHRVANYRMNTQIKEQSKAFIRGFCEVVPTQFIRLFSREELQLLISGKTGKIDLDDLRRNTRYSGGYDENTPVIKWFWQAVEDLTPEDQSKLLQFVTSSPRAPLLGFSYLVPGFCIHRAVGQVRLPTASTCMNLLKLPNYESLDVVREKLRYALASNAGFDLS